LNTTTLKIICEDRKGLISLITSFIFNNNGNIVNLDQYTDTGGKMFFMRAEWDSEGFKLSEDDIRSNLENIIKENGIVGKYDIFYSAKKPRLAIFVSKYNHCLYDLLLKHKEGELNCEIPLIVSNHSDLKYIAEYFGVDFFYIPLTEENRFAQENEEIGLLKEYNIDLIVLARYMQILSSNIVALYKDRIINVHHSFLPAFKGSKPYHQAFQIGVKIIGATSHFVTEKLDQGPIISQDVVHITHRDDVKQMIIKGKDIEKKVLLQAVKLYIENRIFICNNKTIIL